jgi:hypothetical protein
MTNEERFAALEARIQELEAKAEGRAKPRPKEPRPASFGVEGFAPSTYRLIDQMSVPREITREMEERVPTEMLREIVKEAKGK